VGLEQREQPQQSRGSFQHVLQPARYLGTNPSASVSSMGHVFGSDQRKSVKGTHLMDFKLELVILPVSDIDRAKQFYTEQLGFNADHDQTVSDEMRFVQLTPPGSACSIAIGKGLVDTPPGSVHGMQMVVTDIEQAHAELTGRGVDAGEIQDLAWGSFIFLSDPDGNKWAIQQVQPRTSS
jgi:predicted enzyme related to lactoylglutathione lyase